MCVRHFYHLTRLNILYRIKMSSRERLVNQLGFYAVGLISRKPIYIETSGFLLPDEYKPQLPLKHLLVLNMKTAI